jgi:hypothetical protein
MATSKGAPARLDTLTLTRAAQHVEDAAGTLRKLKFPLGLGVEAADHLLAHLRQLGGNGGKRR